MKLNYLIIDDEPIAHKLVERFASELDFMHKVGNCYSAIEAAPVLQERQVDLIFLDLNMPKLKGFSFLQSLPHPPLVIVISAHQEFALEGYKYDIVDYLLKPFNFERFFAAVQKASDRLSSREAPHSQNAQTLFVKDEKKHHRVHLADIRYIEASGNYAIVFLKAGRIMSQMKISDFEKLLPERDFVRIHRSFMVAKEHVTMIKATEVHLGDLALPVGRVYKENVERLFQ